jgi:hypothetical protein
MAVQVRPLEPPLSGEVRVLEARLTSDGTRRVALCQLVGSDRLVAAALPFSCTHDARVRRGAIVHLKAAQSIVWRGEDGGTLLRVLADDARVLPSP